MAINYFVVETLDLSDLTLLLAISVILTIMFVKMILPGIQNETITTSLVASLYNECTGVQNSHRYMHAYNIRSIELHTLHLNRVHDYIPCT